MKKYFIMTTVFLALLSGQTYGQDNSSRTSDDDRSSSSARSGGFFIEPLVSYTQQNSEIKTSQLPVINDNTSGNSNSYGVGLKLGFHANEVVFVGVDGRYARSHFTDSSYGTADGNGYTVGPTIGFQMPKFGMRLLGTYVTNGENNPDAGANGFDVKFRDPQGWRAGVGFRVAAVSINVEYEDLTYRNTDVESFGALGGSGTSSVDFQNRGATVSASFPVEL